MKAFLIGFIFLILVSIMAGIGVLLFPFLIVLGFALRIAIVFALIIFAIWLLGKGIILVWESLRPKRNEKCH